MRQCGGLFVSISEVNMLSNASVSYNQLCILKYLISEDVIKNIGYLQCVSRYYVC